MFSVRDPCGGYITRITPVVGDSRRKFVVEEQLEGNQ
jgi:hypothetical protein